jgi:RecB family exonuclease
MQVENARGEAEEKAYAREMARFLQVVDLTAEELCLAYPVIDTKGQELLPAGFVEDSARLFSDEAWRNCREERKHSDPALLDALSLAPAEARTRAVALALFRGETEELRRLAGSPDHRPVLLGVASALEVAQARWGESSFGRHDGMMGVEAATRIATDFGPGRPAFSPSQLESLAFCPFQFFLRYVLRLDPIDERDELESDHAARGSRIHRVLETLHQSLSEEDSLPLDEQVRERLPALIETMIEEEARGIGGPAMGLDRIEAERLKRLGRRYTRQFALYHAAHGGNARCHRCEYKFGKLSPDGNGTQTSLVIGEGTESVRMQGMIDRIDVIRHRETTLFRVIDYKSGSSPSATDVRSGLALQLPLYALAVERLVFEEESAAPLDVGYWALKGKGFRPVYEMTRLDEETVRPHPTWDRFRQKMERFVIDLVSRLRRGEFPVAPRREDCTQTCDYRHACRIAQVRAVGKAWADPPRLGAEEPS